MSAIKEKKEYREYSLEEQYLARRLEPVKAEVEIDPYLAEIARRVARAFDGEGDDLPENILGWIN
ncbi:MAG: hypothetical protein KGL10_05485 [Alphaproteobacteria bacterium]|nr:hypothetical protein [Alphaproteobacteria bacterium]